MRELKFRAWDSDFKTMIYGFSEGYQVSMDYGTLKVGSNDGNGDYFNLDLMQYVGLKDRNEKEVYEGDIVILPADQKCVVAWDILGFIAVAINPPKDYPRDYRYFTVKEVIGNVYENPNLLK